MNSPARIFLALRAAERDIQYDATSLERLRGLGELVLPADDTLPRIPLPPGLADEADVLITSWSTAPIAPEQLQGSRLRLAAHTAGTIRGLFPPQVLAQGLRLAQGGSDPMAKAVAELAITMTLALLRDVHGMDRRLQSSRDWKHGGVGRLTQSLDARRVGLVGLSRTGRHYARMARGLGVTSLAAYDPFTDPQEAEALGIELVDLPELCERSEVLAIHAPVTDATRGMIDAELIGRLRDGAIVINTARSAVIDMAALTEQLVTGRLRAGLDVFDVEPLPADSPLFGLENVLLTPHVAGGTVEARFQQGAGVVDEVEAFLAGRPLRSEVTLENYERLS